MREIIYPVAETFSSINGEGKFAGTLAFFIRFRKCNLHCSYCDTLWANQEKSPAKFYSPEMLVKMADDSGIENVTLTGGEPLLQEQLAVLIAKLMQHGHHVEIETNGSVSIQNLAEQNYRPSFTLDYKLPSSGMEQFMLTENYQYLHRQYHDVVKFVAGTKEDLEKTAEMIQMYDLLSKAYVYLSPVFSAIEPAEMVDFMKKNHLNQVRLQLQLHKFIWNPEQGGV
ncbi:MAG: putative 7-carboxy-7-deazaguanine synthase QueE [Oscillospiraceae bacterium]|nr:putative 7-carboxy-7-deazaguanine synthase QueE [Oscillospiraceae bacterium]